MKPLFIIAIGVAIGFALIGAFYLFAFSQWMAAGSH